MTSAVVYPVAVPTDRPHTYHVYAPGGVYEIDAFYNVLGQLVELCVAGEAGAVVDKDTLFAVFASAEAMGKLFGAILNQPDPPPPLPDYWEPAAPRPKLPPPPTLKELGQGNLFAIGGQA